MYPLLSWVPPLISEPRNILAVLGWTDKMSCEQYFLSCSETLAASQLEYSFFFLNFNVRHLLLRHRWPWNATKSCQRCIWFSGGQQSKHEHSIINKREWLTGQVRHVTAWRAFRVASYLIESVQLSLIPKCLCLPSPGWGSPLTIQQTHPGEPRERGF